MDVQVRTGISSPVGLALSSIDAELHTTDRVRTDSGGDLPCHPTAWPAWLWLIVTVYSINADLPVDDATSSGLSTPMQQETCRPWGWGEGGGMPDGLSLVNTRARARGGRPRLAVRSGTPPGTGTNNDGQQTSRGGLSASRRAGGVLVAAATLGHSPASSTRAHLCRYVSDPAEGIRGSALYTQQPVQYVCAHSACNLRSISPRN